jgi:hypothetical protein
MSNLETHRVAIMVSKSALLASQKALSAAEKLNPTATDEDYEKALKLINEARSLHSNISSLINSDASIRGGTGN